MERTGPVTVERETCNNMLGDVVETAARLKRAWDAEPSQNSDAEIEYTAENLSLAARDLYFATEALPRDSRPVGWNSKPTKEALPVPMTRDDIDLIIALMTNGPAGEDRVPALHRSLLSRLHQERCAFDRWPED